MTHSGDVDGEAGVFGHLVALVPGQGPSQLPRQRGVITAASASATGSARCPSGKPTHQVAGGAFDQCGDRAHAAAEDQVAFLVSGRGPGRPPRPGVGRCSGRWAWSWPVGQASPGRRVASSCAAARSARAAVTSGLHEQRTVDGLVRHVHYCPGREPPPPADPATRRSVPVTSAAPACPRPCPPAPATGTASSASGRPPVPTPCGRPRRPDSRCGHRCRRPRETPSRAPREQDSDRPQRLTGGQPAGDFSRSASASRNSHRYRGAGRIPPVRLSRSHRRRIAPYLPGQHVSPPAPTATDLIDLRWLQPLT